MPTHEHRNDILKHIAGYTFGITLFVLLIPYGIWRLASSGLAPFSMPLTSNTDVRITLALLFFVPGVVFAIWSNLVLFFKGKGGPADVAGIAISPRTQKLAVTGPYKYTRNPMVFGMNAIYLSMALFFNSLGCLPVLIILFLIMVRCVVLREEERLLADFGADYEAYKKKTSMFIPLPPKKQVSSPTE